MAGGTSVALPLCACNCGQRVRKHGNRYVYPHHLEVVRPPGEPPLSPGLKLYLVAFDAFLRARTPYARALAQQAMAEHLEASDVKPAASRNERHRRRKCVRLPEELLP